MNARAAVFMGAEQDFEIREFPVTAAPSGYGRLELIASGVCGTDLHIHSGRLGAAAPTVIGHEFVGRLVEADEKEAAAYGLAVGDAVIADIAVPCGECLLCKSGDDANCVCMGLTNAGSIDQPPYLWGGYAEVNYTPLSNLIKIPETVDPTVAATFACPGPTAIHAVRLAREAGVKLSRVGCAVVQGLGPVGMFAILYLRECGVRHVYAITAHEDPARERLAIELGADRVYTLAREGSEAITATLQGENGGLGVDLCIECSGVPQAVGQGIEILRNRGVYLIPGQYSNSGSIELQPQIITFKALHILGSSQYSMVDVRDYLRFLAEHPATHPLIARLGTHYPIEETNRAFADAKKRINIKTLLVKRRG